MGIQKNELVDAAAKEAAKENHIAYSRIPHSDMKRPIHEYILKKWQERWISPNLANNRKYRKIRPGIECWPSSNRSRRREEKVLSRMRIGHTYLTHKFILEGNPLPLCDHCQEHLTVEHILVICPAYRSYRLKFQLQGENINSLLNDEGPIDNIMSFLKESGLYYKF